MGFFFNSYFFLNNQKKIFYLLIQSCLIILPLKYLIHKISKLQKQQKILAKLTLPYSKLYFTVKKYIYINITLHAVDLTLHCITLCTTLHITALHYIAHCTVHHCTALHCALHRTSLHCTALHCTAPQWWQLSYQFPS